jgi:hypothetical protein
VSIDAGESEEHDGALSCRGDLVVVEVFRGSSMASVLGVANEWVPLTCGVPLLVSPSLLFLFCFVLFLEKS